MDIGGKENVEQEEGNEDLLSYHSPNVSSDWRFGGSNLTNASIGLISTGNNPMALCEGGLMEPSSSSSAPMMESFCPSVWDHPSSTQSLGFCDINLQGNAITTPNSMGIRKGPLSNGRTLDMGWTAPHPNQMVKGGGMFLPTAAGVLPQSLSQFPADSGFIERAAKFSCFSGGNFGDMVNPFGISDSINPYARGAPMIQQSQQLLLGNRLKSLSGGQSQKNEMNISEASKDTGNEGSPLNSERKSESFVRSHGEAKQSVCVPGNESDEAEFSGGGGGRELEPSMVDVAGGEPSSSKALGLKKRKRGGQDNELVGQINEASQPPGDTAKDNTEIQPKGDQTPTSNTNKPCGKNGKQGSQASDSQKEEYIHVRARRGQATNSHSLAERVRREKISERMKFLQDLVPGCSKVTGKAVMLDEIINYVQSLQRQVEFLSMKLSTVNPRLDFNLEGLLSKDIIHSRAGPSSTLGYSPDITMPFPQLHPAQPGLIQTGLHNLASTSDALRRSSITQLTAMGGGYKDALAHQIPTSMWGEDELHNVVHMGFNSSAPLDSQDLNGSLTPGHLKVEP